MGSAVKWLRAILVCSSFIDLIHMNITEVNNPEGYLTADEGSCCCRLWGRKFDRVRSNCSGPRCQLCDSLVSFERFVQSKMLQVQARKYETLGKEQRPRTGCRIVTRYALISIPSGS